MLLYEKNAVVKHCDNVAVINKSIMAKCITTALSIAKTEIGENKFYQIGQCNKVTKSRTP